LYHMCVSELVSWVGDFFLPLFFLVTFSLSLSLSSRDGFFSGGGWVSLVEGWVEGGRGKECLICRCRKEGGR
jgi:hypothetical protein